MKEKLKSLEDLTNEQNRLQYAWIRQILTLSSGGLALLVALHPEVPSEGIEKYLLVTTWIALGLGILSGSGAAYAEVSLAADLRANYEKEILKILEGTNDPENLLIFGAPSWIFSACKKIMVSSLIVSVVSLVGYAVLRTLNA
jgi:hypothetical protein